MKLIPTRTRHSTVIKHFWLLQCRSLSQFSKQGGNHEQNQSKSGNYIKTALVGAVATGIIGYYVFVNGKHRRLVHASQKDTICTRPLSIFGAWRPDLPTYTNDDLSKHSTRETRIWVSYKEGVYDITEYVAEHPGGLQMLIAAGYHLENFWKLYPFHEADFILARMEKCRIGNLQKKDQVNSSCLPDPYSDEPCRHRNMRSVCAKPYCGGVKLDLLADNFYTPNEYFFVRNHLPVPRIDPKTYEFQLEVEGTDKKLTFTLEEIKDLPKVCLSCTLMCSGNRRREMLMVKNEKKSVSWGPNAMGNAKWTGVRLSDLLKMVGITEQEKMYKHVQFKGMDCEANGTPYSSSIPLSKAVDPQGDVILAYAMNGTPLPADHGFPLRVIIPGHTGARNCKWISEIVVSTEESPCHYQQIDYKSFPPSTTWDNANYKTAPAIQVLPVTSAICRPLDGETIHVSNSCVNVKGYAYSGGGQKIIRVDVSSDCGKTWHVANLDYQDKANPPNHWSWTLWSLQVPVDRATGEAEIWCKAVDSNLNTQPETFENIYNFKGCLCNAYHRIRRFGISNCTMYIPPKEQFTQNGCVTVWSMWSTAAVEPMWSAQFTQKGYGRLSFVIAK